jgi:hypothetical protein
MASHKRNRVAGRLQNMLGRNFVWCQRLVDDTREFAEHLAKTFNVPIESVFLGLGRQAIRAEVQDRRLAVEEQAAAKSAAA